MDPNITLKEILALVATVLHDYEDEEGNGVDQDDACSLASSVETLDAWLRKGGFLPQEWAREVSAEKIGAILGGCTSRCLDDDDDFAVVRDALVEGLKLP